MIANFYYRVKKIFGNWTVFDQALVSGGNFLLIVICAQKLSVEDQGILIYVVSIYYFILFLNIALYTAGSAVTNAKKTTYENKIYYNILAKSQILSALIISFILYPVIYYINEYYAWGLGYFDISMLLIFIFFQQLSDFYRRSAYIFFAAKIAAISSLLLYLPRVVALSMIERNNPDQVYMILALSSLLPVMLLINELSRSKVQFVKNIRVLVEHFYFSRILVVSSLLSWFWSFIPLYVLGFYRGTESVAILGSVRSVVNFVNVFLEQIEISFAAKLPHLFINGPKKSIRNFILKLVGAALAFWFIGFIVFSFYGGRILGFILGENYFTYGAILLILWGSVLGYFLSRIISIYSRSKFNKKTEYFGSIASVLAAILVTPPLVRSFGVNGAAISFLVIFVCSVIAQIIYLRYVNKTTIKLMLKGFFK